jgi:hypothetical protein
MQRHAKYLFSALTSFFQSFLAFVLCHEPSWLACPEEKDGFSCRGNPGR